VTYSLALTRRLAAAFYPSQPFVIQEIHNHHRQYNTTLLCDHLNDNTNEKMSSEAIAAITDSLPPTTDHLTYLTILESHLSPDLLPTLNNILQDADLTQNIGWDLIHILLPMVGADQCLVTIARLGNPREVILKVTEALQTLDWHSAEDAEVSSSDSPNPAEVSEVDKFCLLMKLLSILHPRIKTKYPSRFLSTSLMAILSAFRPSTKATLAVITFAHTVSGRKRPELPGRKSSLSIPGASTGSPSSPPAPDPEAQDEEPDDVAIQNRLLQSFVTHILEDYVNSNPLEWAARLQESFDPAKVVVGRKSLSDTFKEDPVLITRQDIVGHLIVSCHGSFGSHRTTFLQDSRRCSEILGSQTIKFFSMPRIRPTPITLKSMR
jgi:hypothetical protein